MDCLSTTVERSNRKQVRFVSPLISHRQVSSLPSPPPTPLLSPVLTPPQSPSLNQHTFRHSLKDNNSSIHHRNLITSSRSLTCSPQRGICKEKTLEQLPQQRSLAFRLVQTLIKHSYSSDSLQQASKTSTTQTKFYRSKLPSKQPSLPTSFSLNSISSSSNSAIYQLIWRDERERSFDELKGKLGNHHHHRSSSSSSYPSRRRCNFRPEGVVFHNSVGGPSLSNSSSPQTFSSSTTTNSSSLRLANTTTTTPSTTTTTTFHGSSTLGGCGVNICCRASAVEETTKRKKEKKRPPPPLFCHFHKPVEHQKFSSSLFQSSQKRIFCWPPPILAGQVILFKQQKRRLPNSYTFPPPVIMNASPSHHQQQQQAYNELEDFDEDFVPRSSNTARENYRNSMEGHIEERTQIRRMSLKEFSGLDLLEEQANQKASLSPMLHPWRFGQQLTLGSLIDKFSNRRRSSSSGGAKLEGAGLHHSHSSDDGYNSFDRVLDGINQAIRETIASGNNEQTTATKIEGGEKNGVNNHHLEKQYSTGRNTFGQTLQRLTNIRNHLNSTLQSVPNASPRKAATSEPDCEKLVLLNECKELVIACKDMVRNANSSSSPPSSQTTLQTSSSTDCHQLVQTVVDSAERAVDSVEMLIRKSNSIFQAQQLTSNADQLLKALSETVREVEKCQKPTVKSNEQVKQLVRSSTVLTANLISFTELIRNI
uniref:Uncharacterized protein n=1 Tax=Meloidogyne enterolobii TaxID=390850 RepID=A0A6V7UHZ3_MELEN|nr:unnamed protein product [Meloidogyne enterolobii]